MSDPPASFAFSLVVITRDAGAQLADCLQSVNFAAEKIVVDSGSRDDTVEIATRCGARVVEQAWLGFGAQKNFAVALAHHDWVLCLDADERVSPELAQSIRAVLATAPQAPAHAAYMMPRCNRFLGRWLRHGEGYPDWNTRLFDRRRAKWSDDAIHENVNLNAEGSVGRLRGDLLHSSAESLDAYLAKQNHYTTLQAEAMHARGERASLVRMLAAPVTRFIRFYFLRGGCFDGVAGLVHIAVGCSNSFFKYAKLRALEQAERAR